MTQTEKNTDHYQSSINFAETHESKNHTHILLAFNFLFMTKQNNLKWNSLGLKTFETFAIVKRL